MYTSCIDWYISTFKRVFTLHWHFDLLSFSTDFVLFITAYCSLFKSNQTFRETLRPHKQSNLVLLSTKAYPALHCADSMCRLNNNYLT